MSHGSTSGRLQTTTSGKQSIWLLRVGSVAKELGLRDSILRCWVEQRGSGRGRRLRWHPTTQSTVPSAGHAAEIARLQRENERLRMERDILTNLPPPWRTCAG